MRAAFHARKPIHPGGYVKSEIVEANGLSVTDAAQALGVTRPALSALLTRPLAPDAADGDPNRESVWRAPLAANGNADQLWHRWSAQPI